MTHAIEAYVCRASNPVSDALAEKAIELLFAYLERAVMNISGDRLAREEVMRASLLAGMAFGNADVSSVHCLSESIGGVRPDAPHGVANAVLLTPVLRFQMESIRNRLNELGETIRAGRGEPTGDRGNGKAEGFMRGLASLLQTVGIPGFETLGLPEEEFRLVAELAAVNGSNASSPQPMAAPDYLQILKTAASM